MRTHAPRPLHFLSRASVFALTLTLTQSACGPGTAGPDAATDEPVASDAPADASCAPNAFVCRAGEVAARCDGTGEPVMCGADGRVCVEGAGCVACRPGSRRCDPMNPAAIQQCAADGSSYANAETCSGTRVCGGSDFTCVDPCTAPANGLGCEFRAAVTANSTLASSFPFAITVANPWPRDVRLEVSGGGLTAPLVQAVTANTSATVTLPWVDALLQNAPPPMGQTAAANSALAMGGAYVVKTNAPVSVVQFNSVSARMGGNFANTNDASLLLPTAVAGISYTVATWPAWSAMDPGATSPAVLGGFIAVVPASEQPTTRLTLNLTAAVRAGNGVTALEPGMRTVSVPRGAVLQLVARDAGGDLSGTTITADHPVSVFVGHDCAQVPNERRACNHLEESLPPEGALGASYVVAVPRHRDLMDPVVVRVVSASSAPVTLAFTGITAPAACASALTARGVCEFESDHSFAVRATNNVIVTQFLRGQGTRTDACSGANPPNMPECLGDPAMGIEVPEARWLSAYEIEVPTSFTRNYVHVVAPMGATVTLDGVALTGTPGTVGTGHREWVLPVMPGRHRLREMSGVRFGAKVYGSAPYTAYLTSAGWDLGTAR